MIAKCGPDALDMHRCGMLSKSTILIFYAIVYSLQGFAHNVANLIIFL